MNLIEQFNPVKFIQQNYFVDQESYIKSIFFGKHYEFKYLDINNLVSTNESINTSTIHIFKMNMLIIIDYLKYYFPDIEIKMFFDHSNRNECLIKNSETGFTHDIYIQINKSEKYFDCGIDFIPETFDLDNYKYISSLVNLDYYKYFQEDTDNYNDFMSELIYRLLIILCSVNRDEYTLAEILFSRTLTESDSVIAKRDCDIFRKVILAKRDNNINLKNWFDEIIPRDVETGEELNWANFIIYCKSIVSKFNFTDNQTNISYDTFEKIILKINSELSTKIDYYKMIYQKTINLVIESLKLIMDLIESSNRTKKYIPQYINYFLTKDIVKYNDITVLEEVYENLKFLFENK